MNGTKTWEGWKLRSQDTHFSHHKGMSGEGGALFERLVDTQEKAEHETLRRLDANHLRIEEAVGTGNNRRILRTTDLERVVTSS